MRILSQMHARTVHFQPSTQRSMRDLANAEKLREIEFSCRRELVGLSTKKSEHIDNIIEIHYRLRRPYKVQNEPNLIGTSVCGSLSQNYLEHSDENSLLFTFFQYTALFERLPTLLMVFTVMLTKHKLL